MHLFCLKCLKLSQLPPNWRLQRTIWLCSHCLRLALTWACGILTADLETVCEWRWASKNNSFIWAVGSTCSITIHYGFTNSHSSVISTPCGCYTHCFPSCVPLSQCSTHLLNRRPPACMWLWTVCHLPALLPPVTMLRMLSLRLGPASVPEQAPPPLSLAPGEGPAPPCPPLSTAPLEIPVGWMVDKETRTDRKRQPRREEKERDGQTDRRTDVQTRTAEGSSVRLVTAVSKTLCGQSFQTQVSKTLDKYQLWSPGVSQ